ncbi:MAG: hypothetical protein J6I46_02930 [Ruminococcus sp.]|nr:hypothetical protein [Ruminococcus sp.]
MAKKNAGKVKVFLPREFFNSIVSLLSDFIEADEKSKYGKYANELKKTIMTHSKTIKHNETENAAIYLYEDEAATLIKLCALYFSATENTDKDFFQQLVNKRTKIE